MLGVVPAIRGQGWKGKAGAWPPSSVNFLSVTTAFSKSQGALCVRSDIAAAVAIECSGVSTSEMCVRAVDHELCLRVSSLYL